MIKEWKIFLVLRDNAANVACAKRTGNYEPIGCISQTLQLMIKRLLFADEDTNDIINEYRKIVGFCHHSEAAIRKLREYLNQCGLPEHALVQNMNISWDST